MMRMLCLAVGLWLFPVQILAQDWHQGRAPDHEFARDAVGRGEILPLARILARVQQQHPGRVVEVELDDDDGKLIYEIEMVTPDGRYLEIEVDAVSGVVLEYEVDD